MINLTSAAVEKLVAGADLTAAECREAVAQLLDGQTTDASAAAFLTALRIKGETSDELEGAVSAVRERMIVWDSQSGSDVLLDTCGTGGDGANTVNISTAAAIVVAACGVPVAKHGNRAASGVSGSSDVLSALGLAIEVDPAMARTCLAQAGITFLFAPRFHPGLVRLAPVRRQLPFRTIFNLVGPLCNPARPTHQLVGVPHERHASLMANVLSRQSDFQRAAVVTGHGGLDEVTLDGPTHVLLVEDCSVRDLHWTPADFGLQAQTVASIRVGSTDESATKIAGALAGEKGAVRDYIVANSAAALWVARQHPLRECARLTADAIDSGAAARLLDRWRTLAPATVPPDSK